MGKLKQTIIKSFNTLGTFCKSIQEQSVLLVYGENEEILLVDFSNEREREEYMKLLPKLTKRPSLVSINKTLKVINSYDVCNPANFAINQLTQGLLGPLQGQINEVVNAFRGSTLVDSPQTREAFVSPEFDLETGEEVEGSMEFQTTRKVGLVVPFTAEEITNKANIITKGSYVTLTQTSDPKESSFYMKGSVDTSFEVDDPLPGIEYIINVDSMGPSQEPPYERDQKGNILKDSVGEPIPKQFFQWKIEAESKISGDSRELASELNELTSVLRELGLNDLISSLSAIPGTGNLQKTLKEVGEIVNSAVGTPAVQIANTTGTIAQTLDGGLTAEETILRARVLRDFYQKIIPYTNISNVIQNVFKKQVEDINNTLRNVIPYNEIAYLVRELTHIARKVLGAITILIAGLKVINSAIKTIMVVLKVVKIVVKIIKKLIKFIPARWSTVGKIQKITEVLAGWEEGIQTAIDTLKNISDVVTNLMNALNLVRRYLVITIAEMAKFSAKLESCDDIREKGLAAEALNASRNSFLALQNLMKSVPQLDNIGVRGSAGAEALNEGFTTFVFGPGGTIIPLRDSVYGFDEFGNLIFYGDLVSLSTGINFEDTLGQQFRSNLQYYTFNKFKESQRPLLEFADNAFLGNQRVADPDDVFGNFQELYLGYTIKIQEEKPIQATESTLIRRRGLALDSNEKIVVSTDLTFSNNLQGIVDEVRYKLSRNLDQGLIGINTTDSGNNEITDNDALSVASDLGANPIGVNNEKANSNNRATSNIAGQIQTSINGVPINPNEPIETRVGNQPFISNEQDGRNGSNLGAQSKTNTSAKEKTINLDSLITPITVQAQEEDPELKAVRDVLDTIGSVNPQTISNILSVPGNQNLTDEELVSKLKESILSSIDPNPDKVKEVEKKTQQWYEALEKQTKIEWEQLFMRSLITKIPVPPFDVYYDNVEEQELPKWVKFLLRNRYTQTEVDYGISQDEIRDKYKITIGDDGSVKVKLRPAFKKRN
jgi:hypothetical protein